MRGVYLFRNSFLRNSITAFPWVGKVSAEPTDEGCILIPEFLPKEFHPYYTTFFLLFNLKPGPSRGIITA